MVNLPLTPQQGSYATPLDALRGNLFEVYENVALRLQAMASSIASAGPSANAAGLLMSSLASRTLAFVRSPKKGCAALEWP